MNMCEAESYGYTCIRQAGHGDIHVDPKHGGDQYCNVWILEAVDADEEYGRKPMTGYRLLTDTMIVAEAADA